MFDLFPFYNELDLLELRLMELDPVVDVFGLVELPVTFTGLPKPLYYAENKERFAKWNHKIRSYTPAAYPEGPHPTVDWFQRRQIAKLFTDAEPNDIVMLSDVDEIPNRLEIETQRIHFVGWPVHLRLALYYHRVDLQSPVEWIGPVVAPRSCLGDEPDMEQLRKDRHLLPGNSKSGWHFSWLGTVEQVQDKLRAVDIPRESAIFGGGGIVEPPSDPEFLEECRQGRQELFRRPGFVNKQVPILPGVNQPHDIVEWLANHPEYAAHD